MDFTSFLTIHPLYSKCDVDIPVDLNFHQFRWPAVNSFCPVCGTNQTFTGGPTGSPHPSDVTGRLGNKVVVFVFACASCQQYHLYYFVRFLELPSAVKVGQYPALDVAVDKDLVKTLGPHVATFKKGWMCESHGYGIGAYAYYRRIVEEIVDDLLSLIHDLLNEQEKAAYEGVLREAQRDIVAKDKIALVKDLIPATLRPNGMNPLGILHDTLSVGIHLETDEECLDAARDIREILTQLVDQISAVRRSNESNLRLTESMRRLLDKRSQKSGRTAKAQGESR